MLYKTLLFLHMFGLTIGAGTGIYIAAVSRYASKHLDQSQARTLLPGVNGTLSKVGSIGLALLLLSGIGMMLTVGASRFNTAFSVKMALVVAIVVFVGAMHMLAARVRRGDKNALVMMNRIGPIGPLLAIGTLVAAVMAFH